MQPDDQSIFLAVILSCFRCIGSVCQIDLTKFFIVVAEFTVKIKVITDPCGVCCKFICCKIYAATVCCFEFFI